MHILIKTNKINWHPPVRSSSSYWPLPSLREAGRGLVQLVQSARCAPGVVRLALLVSLQGPSATVARSIRVFRRKTRARRGAYRGAYRVTEANVHIDLHVLFVFFWNTCTAQKMFFFWGDIILKEKVWTRTPRVIPRPRRLRFLPSAMRMSGCVPHLLFSTRPQLPPP